MSASDVRIRLNKGDTREWFPWWWKATWWIGC